MSAFALLAILSGCDQPFAPKPAQAVPYPVSLLLPQKIVIHPFTSTKTFDDGTKGVEAHIELRDAYDDPTKAFGDFRFQLYMFKPQSPDPKGRLVASWTEDLQDPKKNAVHWSNVSRTYIFKLECADALPPGKQYVMVAWFSSPYTERLFNQRVFTAGQ